MTASVIFVEGHDDKQFADCLLQHTGIVDIETCSMEGGASKLPMIRPQIMRKHDAGCKIGIVVDADDNFAKRRDEVRKHIKALDLPVADDGFFLIPNNRDPGCIEVLLEQIAVDKHKAVHGCFEQYKACLRNRKYATPNLKAKIYAYCEALGADPKPKSRAFNDNQVWNLDAPALDALKTFLTGFHQSDDGG